VTVFIAQLVNGLVLGSIYALVVTGFNLLLLGGGVIQFAYPNIVVLAMYVMWLVLRHTNDNLALAILVTIVAAIAMNLVSEPLFRPLVRRGANVQTFIIAMAMAMMITILVSRGFNNGVAVAFPQSVTGSGALFRFGLATITTGQVYTLLGSAAAVIALYILLMRTALGRSFRVVAQTRWVAKVLGIHLVRVGLYSFAVAGLLAGVTAVFLAMALGSAGPTLGDTLALKAIAVALFAGLGNLSGGLYGSFILGVAESLVIAYVPGNWSTAISFAMIMVVIMFKPKGLFGARV
jgi:branched-chain amino acid transport system permease protein